MRTTEREDETVRKEECLNLEKKTTEVHSIGGKKGKKVFVADYSVIGY